MPTTNAKQPLVHKAANGDRLVVENGGAIQKAAQAASADGAISQKFGTLHITKTSAAALTLANPTTGAQEAGGDDGLELTIISDTEFAHTVDNSAGAGFNGMGAAGDIATFGGAKGDTLVLEAYAGKWWVKVANGVAIG